MNQVVYVLCPPLLLRNWRRWRLTVIGGRQLAQLLWLGALLNCLTIGHADVIPLIASAESDAVTEAKAADFEANDADADSLPEADAPAPAFAASSVSLAAASSLANRVLVVYNANLQASLDVANYYAAQRGIPAANLLGIRPSSTKGFLDNYRYSKARTEVIAPITNALTQLGQQQILYIVFTYGTPYGVLNDVWTYPSAGALSGASLDAYVCDPFGDAANGPNIGTSQGTTFYANPYSPGQAGTPLAVAGGVNGPVNAIDVNNRPVVVNNVVTYTPFESLASFRARTGKRIYSVFRLDGPNSTIAKAQVDKAIQAEQAGGLPAMNGKFYFDRRNPDSVLQTPPPTGTWIYDRWVEWTLFRTKQHAINAGLTWMQESTFRRIGEPASNIPSAPNAAYYAGTYGWYNTLSVNNTSQPDPWTWVPGAIGMEWKSEGLYGGPRGDNNPPAGTDPSIGWGVGAIKAGITTVTGCITEPLDGGVPRPDAILRNLLEGANIGDAFFRDNWWVGWQQINVGDPLYTPFPGGRAPYGTGASAPLTITCPANISVSPPPGNCGTNVFFATPTTSGGTGTVTIVCNPPSGSAFPLGVNTVNCLVTDSANNTASCSFFVIVFDVQQPVFAQCAPSQTAIVDFACQATVPDFTASAVVIDNCGPISITQSPPAGTLVSSGVTVVTIAANDSAGNVSTCSTTFVARDVYGPVVSCPPPQSAVANANCQAAVPNFVPSVVAADNCSSVVVTQIPAAGTLVGLGTTAVTINVIDSSGNTTACVTLFTVTGNCTPALTVASANPSSGVAVTVSPNDNNGQGSGTTQFSRSYNQGQVVTLTAPATVSGNSFQKWQRDGADWSTTLATTVTMDTSHTMTAIYVPPFNAGLVGYWKLDDASGLSAVDSSGNGNNGTLVSGPTWASGQFGGGLSLDGVNDFVSVNNAPALNPVSQITLSAWIRPSNPSVSGEIIAKDPNSTTAALNQYFLRLQAGGKVRFAVAGIALTGATVLPANTWHLVTGTYDGATLRVYVDGALDGSLAASVTMADNGLGVRLGARQFTTALPFPGQLDEARIYNRALALAEVQALLNPFAVVARTLTINSSNPGSGVSITVSPSDNNNQGSGVTSFARVYNDGALVNLTAPALASGNHFQKWQRDGADWATTLATSVTLDANHTMTAIYLSNVPPAAALTAPANGATFTAGANITLNATATDSDGAISKVDFFAGSTLLGTATVGSGNVFSITWNNVAAGNYALTARATDDSGANTTSTPAVNITVTAASDPTLVGYWKLDDGSGFTAADASGNGNTGALINGPVWSAGASSGALSFDGVNDYVDLGNGASLNPTTAITLVAWVKANSTTATDELIAKSNATTTQYDLRIQAGGKLRAVLGTAIANGATTVTLGVWHQLAATYDGAMIKLYVDGALDGTLAASGAMSNNGINVRLGGRAYTVPLTLNGVMDAARIYNRALSQAELQALTP